MKRINAILVIMFFATTLVAQDWHEQIAKQSKLIDKITSNEDWQKTYNFAIDTLGIRKELLHDIAETIKFKSSNEESTIISHFFHSICDTVYGNFPYRRSGHLTPNLYTVSYTHLTLPTTPYV